MKKLNYLLIAAASVFLFAACANGTENSGPVNSKSFPENATSFTLPKDCERIDFPSSYAGKKAYVIYSNESGISQYNTLDGVNNNVRTAEESSDSLPSISVYRGVIDMGDGYVRDEVQFNNPDLSDGNNNSRAAGIYASYNSGLSGTLNVDDTKPFWVTSQGQNTDSTTKNFTLKAIGSHCRIWAYNNNSSVVDITSSIFNWGSLANAIDSSYNKITAICGSTLYNGGSTEISANQNTKLEVLVYDIFGDATSDQSGGVFGYFNSWDFWLNSYINAYNAAYNDSNPTTSNECLNIHIDSYFLSKDFQNNKKTVQSTLIHEFQHLLNKCNKGSSYQTWFTEMLSMSVEELFQTHLGLADNETPKNRFYGNFDKPYNGFYNWPGNNDSNVYYAYANAYAFGAYLMRNYGGVKLIHEIATNPYVNANAITTALHSVGYENESFETVFKKFGMVYINTKKADNSFYKGFSEIFSGTTYTLSAIDLSPSVPNNKKYWFKTYNTQTELLLDWNNNLYTDDNAYGTLSNGKWCIVGPRIFKPSYKMTEPIQGYGFAVYYIGDITAGGASFSVKHKSNLSMTVVVK